MKTCPTVFVVDQDTTFGNSIATLVGSTGLNAKLFTCPFEYLAQFDEDVAGVLLSETRFVRANGLHFLELLAARRLHPPVIFATRYADVASARQLLRLGAFDYLPKSVGEAELYDAIQQGIWQDERHRAEYRAERDAQQRFARLTDTDRTVVQHVLQGFTNEQIAAQLDVSRRTIEDRRARIRNKLQTSSLPQLLLLAIKAGFPVE